MLSNWGVKEEKGEEKKGGVAVREGQRVEKCVNALNGYIPSQDPNTQRTQASPSR